MTGDLRFRELGAIATTVHTCGLTISHQAYCWGFNRNGQLGDGTTIDRTTPVAVVGGLRFREVSGAARHTCAITLGNRAYCWGDDEVGQPGDGSTTEFPASRPFPVAVAGGLRFHNITTGEFHSCGIATGNAAYCWGANFNFQLGTPGEHLTPAPVTGGLEFREVSAGGGEHNCGVATGHVAYCWGAGHLGDGTNDPSLTPVPVGAPAP